MSDWSATGFPRAVALRIIEETYQRTIGLRLQELKHYQAFSVSVYGELVPPIISGLWPLVRAHSGILLLDLCSGVRIVVLQAASQSGCPAFAIQMMQKPAEMA